MTVTGSPSRLSPIAAGPDRELLIGGDVARPRLGERDLELASVQIGRRRAALELPHADDDTRRPGAVRRAQYRDAPREPEGFDQVPRVPRRDPPHRGDLAPDRGAASPRGRRPREGARRCRGRARRRAATRVRGGAGRGATRRSGSEPRRRSPPSSPISARESRNRTRRFASRASASSSCSSRSGSSTRKGRSSTSSWRGDSTRSGRRSRSRFAGAPRKSISSSCARRSSRSSR